MDNKKNKSVGYIFWLAICLFWIPVLSFAALRATDYRTVYSNQEYAFTINSVDTLKPCIDRGHVSLHGVVFIYMQSVCQNSDHEDRFLIEGSWNTQSYFNLNEYATRYCPAGKISGTKLSLAGLDVVKCEAAVDGMMETHLYAQRQSVDQSITGRINYQVISYCRKDGATRCDNAIRNLVSSFRLAPIK